MGGCRHPLTSPRNRTLRLVLLGVVLFGVFWWFKNDQNQKNKFQDIISGAIPRSRQSAGALGAFDPSLSPDQLRSSSTSVGHKHDKSRKAKYVDLRQSIPWTTFDGGEYKPCYDYVMLGSSQLPKDRLPGYSVFSNVYLYGGILHAVSADETSASLIPEAKSIMSGARVNGHNPPAGSDRWSTIVGGDLARSELGTRAIRLPGVTYIFNDPEGNAGFLTYYQHMFPEALVPAVRAVASVVDKENGDASEVLPSRVIFARCNGPDGFKDEKGRNIWTLSRLFPNVPIEDGRNWADRAESDLTYLFERVVIIDRWAAHSFGKGTSRWGKMNGEAHTMPARKGFWEPLRENMLAAVGDTTPNVGKYKLPVVVFVERDSKPMLMRESHDAVVAELKRLTPRAEIHVTQLSSMTRAQQVSLLSKTDVLVGLHGMDFLEAAWMRPEGSAIEIFEEGGFNRDYGIFLNMLNIDHTVIQKDKVLMEAEWINHEKVRGPDKDLVEVDAKLVAKTVEEKLDRLTR